MRSAAESLRKASAPPWQPRENGPAAICLRACRLVLRLLRRCKIPQGKFLPAPARTANPPHGLRVFRSRRQSSADISKGLRWDRTARGSRRWKQTLSSTPTLPGATMKGALRAARPWSGQSRLHGFRRALAAQLPSSKKRCERFPSAKESTSRSSGFGREAPKPGWSSRRPSCGGGGAGGAFAVEMHQVGEDRLAAQLAKHGRDLA